MGDGSLVSISGAVRAEFRTASRRYNDGVRRFDRGVGLTITTASAIASTALLVWIMRIPVVPGDVTWPALLVATVAAVGGWVGVWAWGRERWMIAAPAVFLGSLGSAGFMSFLALIPIGFAGLALSRAIRSRMRTA